MPNINWSQRCDQLFCSGLDALYFEREHLLHLRIVPPHIELVLLGLRLQEKQILVRATEIQRRGDATTHFPEIINEVITMYGVITANVFFNFNTPY